MLVAFVFMATIVLLLLLCLIILASLSDHPRHFDQMLKIFEQLGTPSKDRPYLFLGGYVDKGPRSVDAMALLFLYKAGWEATWRVAKG